MALTKICQTFGRQFTSSITGAKTATRVYYVNFDTNVDDLSDVVTAAIASGLPDLGDPYGVASAESELVVTLHTPSEIDKERGFYSIEVQYASNTSVFYTPTTQPWTISFSSIKESYVPEQTLADAVVATGMPAKIKPVGINKPILNTAEFPFDPPVVDLKTKTLISLRKNFSDITDLGTIATVQDLIDRINTVNDDASIVIAGITGLPLQFLLDDANITNVESNGELFYAVDLKIIYDPEYHVQKILNAGWQTPNGNKIKGLGGGDIANPWPLDINGDPIRGAAAARAAAAIYRGFCVKGLSTFADLGLPTAYGSSGDLPIT